jgi:SAM-dependent methyltransferase
MRGAAGRVELARLIKRLLIPLWNGVHRLVWWLREEGNAIVCGRIERCEVCGRVRPMVLRTRVIPPRLRRLWELTPGQAEALARKETSDCLGCGAKLRCRRLARVLMELYPVAGVPPRSLADWASRPESQRLRIAGINRISGVDDQLRPLPRFQPSDYMPGAAPGQLVDGYRNEDLNSLTYADESFDLVLSSETLEHVPDLARALAEIHRVLVPGGRHIFTIPRLPGVAATFARARLEPDGSVTDLAPRIYHPGGDWGYLVYTEFGTDILGILERAGFAAHEYFGPPRDDDLAQVIVAEKRS